MQKKRKDTSADPFRQGDPQQAEADVAEYDWFLVEEPASKPCQY